MKKKILKIIGLIFASILVVMIGIVINYLSGAIIFGGRLSSDYNRPTIQPCNQWHKDFAFADLREDKEDHTFSVRNCEDSKKIPRREHFVINKLGQKILYVEFEQDNVEDKPIWLHVHGITNSFLHGVRYYDAANRLGFQLMAVELQNHGGSERHPNGSSWGCQEQWDIAAVLQDLQKRYPKKKILITATSMGTVSTSQAAMSSPENFANVRALVYESAFPNIKGVYEVIFLGMKLPQPGTLAEIMYGITNFLTTIRIGYDIHECLDKNKGKTFNIPTLVHMSKEEFHSTRSIEIGQDIPVSKESLAFKLLEKGSHSTYWNSNPYEFEADIKYFWQYLKLRPADK